jgi:hypothetical protein
MTDAVAMARWIAGHGHRREIPEVGMQSGYARRAENRENAKLLI